MRIGAPAGAGALAVAVAVGGPVLFGGIRARNAWAIETGADADGSQFVTFVGISPRDEERCQLTPKA